MHRDPCVQFRGQQFRQQTLEIRIPPRDADLTNADAKPCANGRELRQIAIRAQREPAAIDRHMLSSKVAIERILMIETDQRMIQ